MSKIILGLAGEIAGGKSTVAQYIKERCEGNYYRFSTSLRKVAQQMYLEENRENLQKISTIFRQNFFDDILSAVIAKDVEKDEHKIVAIDGVRRLADIVYLDKFPAFKLIYIDASIEKRYQRIIQRGENKDDNSKTFEEFKNDHKKEAERQIKNVKAEADFIIYNNESLEKLYQQLDVIIQKLKK